MTTSNKSRAEELKGVFNAIGFIHRYRIFRPFMILPPQILYGFGHFFGAKFVARPRLKKYLLQSLEALYGNKIPDSKKQQIIMANSKYMASMVLDAMLYSPNIYSHTLHHFIEFKNLNYLDAALEEGHGAIIISAHVGMYFHLIAGLVYHPRRYEVLVINRARNQAMYEYILRRPGLKNLHTLIHDKFAIIKDKIIQHLHQNGVVVFLQDYSKKHQLQVPVWESHLNYLITTPQSAIRIHHETQAPLLPVLIKPQDILGFSLIEFIDPIVLQNISMKYRNGPEKQFHGELSIAINHILFPYLYVIPHIWEELRKFGIRISDQITFSARMTIRELTMLFSAKMESIIINSYEPARIDQVWLEKIHRWTEKLSTFALPWDNQIRINNTINLSKMTAIERLHHIHQTLINFLNDQQLIGNNFENIAALTSILQD